MTQQRNMQLSNQLVETPVSSSFGFQPAQQAVPQSGFGVTCSPGLVAPSGPTFEGSVSSGSFGTSSGMAVGYTGMMPPPPVPVPAATGSARSSLSSEASLTSPHVLTHYRDSQGSCASSFTHDPYSYGDVPPVASPAMGLANSNRRSSFMAADQPPLQAPYDQIDMHSTTSSSCGDSISTASCYSGVPAAVTDMSAQQPHQQVVANVRTVSQVIQIPHAPNGNPRSRHHITRAGPNQRFGAWIRGNAITNVVPGGPADQAGLIVGMRILFVDGQPADAATVSSNIRKTWKDVGSLELIVETQLAGTRSKRSLAKARARARSRALAEGEGAMSDALVHPVAPPPQQ